MVLSRFLGFAPRLRGWRPDVKETSYLFFGFLTWVPAIIFFNSHVGQATWINGVSMYPYFNKDFHETKRKDVCWESRYKPADGLQRGMVVTFWSPSHPEVHVVKRVIGLEGDVVHTRAPYPFPVAEVPAGHIWVEGDGGNSGGGRKSLDSNTYGPISKSAITGRITRVLWPLNSAGPIRWWEFKGKRPVIKAERNEMFSGRT